MVATATLLNLISMPEKLFASIARIGSLHKVTYLYTSPKLLIDTMPLSIAAPIRHEPDAHSVVLDRITLASSRSSGWSLRYITEPSRKML
jgi:hypothetical protein